MSASQEHLPARPFAGPSPQCGHLQAPCPVLTVPVSLRERVAPRSCLRAHRPVLTPAPAAVLAGLVPGQRRQAPRRALPHRGDPAPRGGPGFPLLPPGAHLPEEGHPPASLAHTSRQVPSVPAAVFASSAGGEGFSLRVETVILVFSREALRRPVTCL